MHIRRPITAAMIAFAVAACAAPPPPVSTIAAPTPGTSAPATVTPDPATMTPALSPSTTASPATGEGTLPQGWRRHVLSNLGVSVGLPDTLRIRTRDADELPGMISSSLDLDGDLALTSADRVTQSAIGPVGLLAVSDIGVEGTMYASLRAMPIRVHEVIRGSLETPAGPATLAGSAPGGWHEAHAFVDVPADDWELDVLLVTPASRAAANDLFAEILASLEVTGPPAQTTAPPANGSDGTIPDAPLDAWLPHEVAGVGLQTTTTSGRWMLTNPGVDVVPRGSVLDVCPLAAATADDLGYGVQTGQTASGERLTVRSCRIAGFSASDWQRVVPRLADLGGNRPVFAFESDGQHVRWVIAGNTLLVISAPDEGTADAVVAALPDGEPGT